MFPQNPRVLGIFRKYKTELYFMQLPVAAVDVLKLVDIAIITVVDCLNLLFTP